MRAEDAIRTAVYRCYHAKHATGPQVKPGSMMFAALTPEQATTLCELAQFRARLVVSCFHGPLIVTLSGDSDAVDEALEKLDSMRLITCGHVRSLTNVHLRKHIKRPFTS